MTNYIYLLQEREFIKTKEPVYKVGMTTKENHKRFNQYPKGSILLIQLICNNCKNIEKHIIKLFKEQFKHRKDIGNEYFEGDYHIMIDVIYCTIKNESTIQEDSINNEEDHINNEEDHINNGEYDEIYEISTYEEWIKFNEISKIIITNKKKGEGFLRFKNQLWRKLYDKDRFDFDENWMEDLLGYIKYWQKSDILKNKITNEFIRYKDYLSLDSSEQNNFTNCFVNVEYNVEKIFKDVIKKCYVKNYDVYNLNYHEYVFPMTGHIKYGQHFIFNSQTFTFIPVDELVHNKVLTDELCYGFSLYLKNIINVDIVDDILNSLILHETKIQYKKLVYNLIVEQEEAQIIFYDYNECLLKIWIHELLYSISRTGCVNSCEYYDDKPRFEKLLKTQKPRCVIIRDYKKKSINTQIETFCKLGFKNIIVCQNDKKRNMYNISNFMKYLDDNKEMLIKYINEGTNCKIDERDFKSQKNESIFYRHSWLLTDFLKWCCTK